MSGLHISLFGGLLLESGGRILPPISSRVGRSLFGYLVVNRHRELTRDLLAGTFWPDMPDAQARRRLSQALWQIQTVLDEARPPEDYVLSGGDAVRFNTGADYRLDTEEFERAIAPIADGPERTDIEVTMLASAVELYRGDVLAGYYEDWVILEQQRLREMYYGALERLSTLHKSRGEFERALTYARRLSLHDPLREEAHREVMRLCYLAGRVNEALAQFELCTSILDEELGSGPAPATTRLYDEITSQRRAGTVPFVAPARSPLEGGGNPPPMIGRVAARASALAVAEAALAGRGGIVLVEGEAGIGKTRLLEAFSEDAGWRGLTVVWGESPQPGAVRSYQPLAGALSGGINPLRAEQLAVLVGNVWLQEITRLAPGLADLLPGLPAASPLEPAEEPARMREAIVRVLTGLGRIAAHLVILDDFQWADDDTVAAVARLAGELADSRLVLCLSYRTQPARRRPALWEALRNLDASAPTERIALAPLSAAETAELARRRTASPLDAVLVDRLHRETGGNPLFILETLQAFTEHHLAARGAPDTEDATWAFPLPANVLEVISGRLATLDPIERDVLAVFAVHGIESTPQAVLDTSDRTRLEVLESLDELVRRGILISQGGRYRFRHHQVQRVAYGEIAAPLRKSLHEVAARVLAQLQPGEPSAIAQHFETAGCFDEAARYAERAANQSVEMRAYGTAARHYEAALRSARRAGFAAPEMLELLSHYERVLDVLGRRETQVAVLEEMERRAAAIPGRVAGVARRRALYLANTDRFPEAEEAARSALDADRLAGDQPGIAEDLIVLGQIGIWSGEPAQAVDSLEQAVAAGAGDAQVARARQALGSALCTLQRYEPASIHAAAALALFEKADDRRGQAEALGLLGVISMERGRVEESMGHYQRAIDLCRDIGYRHGEAVNLVNLGNACLFLGTAASALDAFTRAAASFGVLGNRRGEAIVRANAAWLHHSLLGDDATAADYCRSALDYFREIGDERGEAMVLANLAGIARRAGDRVGAHRHIEAGLEAAGAAGDRWVTVQLLQAQALLHLDMGAAGEATDAAARGLTFCRELGLADFEASLLSLQGMALLGRGETRAALQATGAAVKLVSPGTDQAYLVPYRHAVVLKAAGRESGAIEFVREAHELLTSRLEGFSNEQRTRALSLPEHQAILDAYRYVAPRRKVARLARRDVPTGRPLTDDDFVEVTWTVTSPEDEDLAPIERRRHRLRRVLDEAAAQNAAPTVQDLAAAMDVSVTTVRRDLRALRAAGSKATTRGSRSPGR